MKDNQFALVLVALVAVVGLAIGLGNAGPGVGQASLSPDPGCISNCLSSGPVGASQCETVKICLESCGIPVSANMCGSGGGGGGGCFDSQSECVNFCSSHGGKACDVSDPLCYKCA